MMRLRLTTKRAFVFLLNSSTSRSLTEVSSQFTSKTLFVTGSRETSETDSCFSICPKIPAEKRRPVLPQSLTQP